MSDFEAIADRAEIEALRAEFTEAAIMQDGDCLASLFTRDGVLRMPGIAVEFHGREEIRAGRQRLAALWRFFARTTHPGTTRLDGDTASGSAYTQELGRGSDGRQVLNYAIYHDRYQRTSDGWKFAERVYQARYVDAGPLASDDDAVPNDGQSRRPGEDANVSSP